MKLAFCGQVTSTAKVRLNPFNHPLTARGIMTFSTATSTHERLAFRVLRNERWIESTRYRDKGRVAERLIATVLNKLNRKDKVFILKLEGFVWKAIQ